MWRSRTGHAPISILASALAISWLAGCEQPGEANRASNPVVGLESPAGIIEDSAAFESALAAYERVAVFKEALTLYDLAEMIGSNPTHLQYECAVVWVFKLPDQPAAHRLIFRADSVEPFEMIQWDTVLTSAYLATSP